jgi:hypothetical protein
MCQADESTYVALDAKGKPTQPEEGARPHACVLDKSTGLVWQVRADDNGPHDKDWTYS